MFLILNCMDSVGIAESNFVFNVSFQCGEGRNDPILENLSVLLFRLVWKLQTTEPEIKNNVTF